jgi:hypothetical protein
MIEGKNEQAAREYVCSGLRSSGTDAWAIRTADWCLLRSKSIAESAESGGCLNARSFLFKKPEDRWEVNDIRSMYLDLAEGLEATLSGFVAATQGTGPLKVPKLPRINDAVAREGPKEGD